MHPYQREKMAIRENHGTSRSAETFYEVVDRFDRFALIRVLPKTGRTHQIRAHLAHLGFPIVGDDKYGDFALNRQLAKNRGGTRSNLCLTRMFLHASSIQFKHPLSGQRIKLIAPLSADLRAFIDHLEQTKN